MRLAVIFDIGGVISPDLWETMLLDPVRGIAVRHRLPRETVRAAGKMLWDEFARGVRGTTSGEQEIAYWVKFCARVGLDVPPADLIAQTESFIEPIEGMLSLIDRLRADGVQLGICSNQTEFWYHRICSCLDLERRFAPETVVLSCRTGAFKRDRSGAMFRAAAAAVRCAPESCILIDDRALNLERALDAGFSTILFPASRPFGHRYLERLLGMLLH